ncbi:MAG: hypothetical protein M1358_14010 [Chloroflexi bacterium]|nr:hypothetical protein [Chloroflexota bacterium]
MNGDSRTIKELAAKRVSMRTFLMGVGGAAALSIFGGTLAGCSSGGGATGWASAEGK